MPPKTPPTRTADPAPPETRPTKADVIKEFREKEIIEAARRVFTREGFKKASMEKIAEEAGLAKGTVYLYFPNKDQLVAATLEAGADQFFGRAREESSTGGDPAERIRTLIRSMIEHAEEERDFQRALFIELNEWLFDASRLTMVQRLIARHEEFISYIAGIISEGIAAGTFDTPDPRRAAGHLYHLLGGAFRERLIGLNVVPIPDAIREVSDFYLQALTPKGNRT